MRAIIAACSIAVSAALSGGAPDPDNAGTVRVLETGFDPLVHGWAIVNSFPGLPVSLGPLDRFAPEGAAYGLCGGMCFAALDAFTIGAHIPRDLSRVPERGSSLHRWFYRRQAATLGFFGRRGLRYVQWTFASDSSVERATREELEIVLARLARGEPTPIGLIYASARNPRITSNHQVVVVGAAIDERGVSRLKLYDPNFPNRADVEVVVPRAGSSERRTGDGRTRRVRGFFVTPYTPREFDRGILFER